MRLRYAQPADPAIGFGLSKLAGLLEANTASLSARQLEALALLDGPQRHTLLYGGSRSGKTYLFLYRMLERAVSFPGSYHAAMRFRSNAARQSIGMLTLPMVAKTWFPDITLIDRAQDGFFELPNESRIYVGGLDDKERVDKILGQEYATILLNECSQIPYSSVLTALTRLAQKIDGLPQQLWADLNPVGRGHWSHALFIEKRDPITKTPLANSDDYAVMTISPEDNAANLDPAYVANLKRLPSRQRKRFFEGAFQDETPGALWTSEMLDRMRLDTEHKRLGAPSAVPELRRVVVAVDPSGAGSTEDTSHDAIGIVVAGLGIDGHAYVLADYTLHGSPAQWGRKAVQAFYVHQADCVLAEVNFGGAMVEHVLKTADPSVPVKTVTSSRGKVLRAEPVAALCESRPADGVVCRVHHVTKELEDGTDHLAALEDELLAFSTTGYTGERSPNRADAYVIALSELMLQGSAEGWLQYYEREAMRAQGKLPPLTPWKSKAQEDEMSPVDMKGVTPHHNLYLNARRYTADAEGVVRGVHHDDVDIFRRLGYKAVAEHKAELAEIDAKLLGKK